MKIAVAVSGGIDSLYALFSLHEEGHDVLALHGQFLPHKPQVDPLPGLLENCKQLDIPLYIYDARKIFQEQVIRPFARQYANGKTPNPCAHCNAHIKFGLLRNKALSLGYDAFATGHYARLIHHQIYGQVLAPAFAHNKDQSYFLALTPRHALENVFFPLSNHSKETAREVLSKHGLTVPVPQESQEICFIPQDDYRSFLQTTLAESFLSETSSTNILSGKGPILLSGSQKVLGQHQGLWRYTEGQRRGHGISWQEALYVVGKDISTNTLYLGTKDYLYSATCHVEKLNIHVDLKLWPKHVFVRTRYRQQAQAATLTYIEETTNGTVAGLNVHFQDLQSLTAPGQVAAIFDTEGHLLGGGLIHNPKQHHVTI